MGGEAKRRGGEGRYPSQAYSRGQRRERGRVPQSGLQPAVRGREGGMGTLGPVPGYLLSLPAPPFQLDTIYTERERCHLENGYGTHLQAACLVAILATSLGVNGAIEIKIFAWCE